MEPSPPATLQFNPTERLQRPALETDGLVIAGYVTGVLLPIVGFFLGFALVLKNRVAHGVAIMVLSVLVPVAALGLVASADARVSKARMTFDFARTIAVDYWAKRAVDIPCQPTRRVLSADESTALDEAFGYGVTMVTYPNACEILISPVGEAYRVDRDIDLQWLYCTDVVHEVGHIAGLTHDFGGVMAVPPQVPWACAHPRRFRRLVSVTRDGWTSRGSLESAASRTVSR